MRDGDEGWRVEEVQEKLEIVNKLGFGTGARSNCKVSVLTSLGSICSGVE